MVVVVSTQRIVAIFASRLGFAVIADILYILGPCKKRVVPCTWNNYKSGKEGFIVIAHFVDTTSQRLEFRGALPYGATLLKHFVNHCQSEESESFVNMICIVYPIGSEIHGF